MDTYNNYNSSDTPAANTTPGYTAPANANGTTAGTSYTAPANASDTAAGTSYTAPANANGTTAGAGYTAATAHADNNYTDYTRYSATPTGEQNWSYSYQNAGTAPATAQKKAKKHGHAGVVFLVIACLLFSCFSGFAGGWYANHLSTANALPSSSATSSGTTNAGSQSNYTASYLASQEGLSLTELTAKVTPTVVSVTTEYTVQSYWMQSATASGAGSGVIISADGYIITNNHVIDDANSIKVTLSTGDSYDATLVATDSQSDIAVLKIDANDLPYATVGDSDALVVGQDVVAVGNPLGELGGTVTNGIVSALGREVTVEDQTMTLIQTNAAINPGNSGGGLFDAEGNLIGIVNSKYSSTGVEGLGFAIPINVAMKSAQDLMSVGYVTGRVSIGVNLLAINDEQTAFQYRVSRLGVYIYSTVSGSSAEIAGLKSGDYIMTVDGTEVSSIDEIKSILNSHEIGDTVTIHVLRDTTELDCDVILTEYIPEDKNN